MYILVITLSFILTPMPVLKCDKEGDTSMFY